MTAATNFFLENDSFSFSKILLSKVADIIKQVLQESTNTVHSDCNDKKNFKGENYV